MKYQENFFFFTSKDIASTQNAEGAELKSVLNNSKNMFQQISVKKLKHILSNISEYIININIIYNIKTHSFKVHTNKTASKFISEYNSFN